MDIKEENKMSEFKIEKGNYVVLAELTDEQHEAFYDLCVNNNYDKCDSLSIKNAWLYLGIDEDLDIIYDDLRLNFSMGEGYEKNITKEFLEYYNEYNTTTNTSEEASVNIIADNLVESLQEGDVVTTKDRSLIYFQDKLINDSFNYEVRLNSNGFCGVDFTDIISIKRGGVIIYEPPKPLPKLSKVDVEVLRAYEKWFIEQEGFVDDLLEKYLSEHVIQD